MYGYYHNLTLSKNIMVSFYEDEKVTGHTNQTRTIKRDVQIIIV